jgi:very-short-patch-repair endonuclease
MQRGGTGGVARSAGVVGVILPTTTSVNGMMATSQRLNNSHRLLDWRRTLRANLTPAEAALWRMLRRSSLNGRKFRRQQSIGPYIVDFYCPSEKLVVELEGAAHDGERAANRDEVRERFLRSLGLTVVRLENRHVLENPEGVLAYISQHFGIS